VTEVAEKNPISDIATCGIYWYRKGSEFVSCAETMIQKNIRVNNEFYIAPVYNELINSGKTLIPFFVHRMHGIGTPEDLNSFLGRK
jgi:dTDP-glucose pyrophosphorylase